MDIIYRIIGRIIILPYLIRILFISNKTYKSQECYINQLDKTSITSNEALNPGLAFCDKEIIFALYNNLSFSLWRSQEFSLFSRFSNKLQHPMADFGCGDGTFGSILFKKIDYGIDIDKSSLNIAKKSKAYKKLLQSSNSKIPLDDDSVNSVFSNSVLEHCIDLQSMLSEISRILKVRGLLIFTVPVAQFKDDFSKYFGKTAGEWINKQFYHRNLFSHDKWKTILKENGF